MGYSITTPIYGTKKRDKLFDFLESHFVYPHKILGHKVSYSCLKKGDFSYDSGRCCIGFDYSAIFGFEREYIYTICRWLALKQGRKQKKFDGFTSNIDLPYIIYDGIDKFPVILRGTIEVTEEMEWAVVDQYGWKPCAYEYELNNIDDENAKKKLKEESDWIKENIHREIIRLDEVYEKYFGNSG